MSELKFTVDSALLSELGEKLVESVHVALLELVKNSYDADARKVDISINTNHPKYGCYISVVDNGSGMTDKEVQNYWMKIATTNKVKANFSPKYGRKRSGAKGIGRFSCRRLGSKLKLITTALLPDGRYETTEFTVDWNKFIAGTNIDSVICIGEVSYNESNKTGTTLEITGGKSEQWNKRAWGVLKRRLMLLISNRGTQVEGYSRDPGFNISLEAPDFEENKIVNPREQLMNAGWGRIRLEIGVDGTASWTLVAKRLASKTEMMPDKYPDFAGTTADIAIIPHNRNQFRKADLITGCDFANYSPLIVI